MTIRQISFTHSIADFRRKKNDFSRLILPLENKLKKIGSILKKAEINNNFCFLLNTPWTQKRFNSIVNFIKLHYKVLARPMNLLCLAFLKESLGTQSSLNCFRAFVEKGTIKSLLDGNQRINDTLVDVEFLDSSISVFINSIEVILGNTIKNDKFRLLVLGAIQFYMDLETYSENEAVHVEYLTRIIVSLHLKSNNFWFKFIFFGFKKKHYDNILVLKKQYNYIKRIKLKPLIIKID